MKFKIKIKPKLTYYFSILASSIILFYFAYKAIVAYLIHRELYGGGLDTLVLLRASISGIMLLLICLLYTSPSPRDTNPSRMPSSA